MKIGVAIRNTIVHMVFTFAIVLAFLYLVEGKIQLDGATIARMIGVFFCVKFSSRD